MGRRGNSCFDRHPGLTSRILVALALTGIIVALTCSSLWGWHGWSFTMTTSLLGIALGLGLRWLLIAAVRRKRNTREM
jgi:D-alanyl-lipoteichoic acid acyltransferase DltB (MBOAT superfamily)